jgi:hypothetical protein
MAHRPGCDLILKLRVATLAIALVVAGITNVFFAPQLYTPRPPVFTGSDMVAIDEWADQGYRLHPVWLAENLPGATFTNLRTSQKASGSDTPGEIGLLWDKQIVELAGLQINSDDFPLDVTTRNIRPHLSAFEELNGSIRCRVTLNKPKPHRCNYFVAWDESDFQAGHSTFIAVFTNTDDGKPEIGFVQESLLQRLLPEPISRIPRIGQPGQ